MKLISNFLSMNFVILLKISVSLTISLFVVVTKSTIAIAQANFILPPSDTQLIMTEDNAPFDELMKNGRRALNKEEALRLFSKARSRINTMVVVPTSKRQEFIQEVENALINIDKISFAENREKLARDFERSAVNFRNNGRKKEADNFQKWANKIRSGKITSIYDALLLKD